MNELRTRTVYEDRRVQVSIVQSLNVRTSRSNQMRLLVGSVMPVAIIVTEADRSYVLDMNAGLVEDLAALIGD